MTVDLDRWDLPSDFNVFRDLDDAPGELVGDCAEAYASFLAARTMQVGASEAWHRTEAHWPTSFVGQVVRCLLERIASGGGGSLL